MLKRIDSSRAAALVRVAMWPACHTHEYPCIRLIFKQIKTAQHILALPETFYGYWLQIGLANYKQVHNRPSPLYLF